ncbi:MAG: hypothetical protein Ta2A_12520 [Treponemataceae bacterium]|nr:MAG: hypothetical protein Ta2A_12520 [Treponemataceae bacterium]
MGISVASENQYASSLRSLFPQGKYWDEQFADNTSDCSLFCKAKTSELIILRTRMKALFLESSYETAVETIDDWERELLGYTNTTLPIDERREKINEQQHQSVNRTVLNKIAAGYGLHIANIAFPFPPSFFGFAHFALEPIANGAGFSVLWIYVQIIDAQLKTEMENYVQDLLTAGSFGLGSFALKPLIPICIFRPDLLSVLLRDRFPALNDFENGIKNKLLGSNIPYFVYNQQGGV